MYYRPLLWNNKFKWRIGRAQTSVALLKEMKINKYDNILIFLILQFLKIISVLKVHIVTLPDGKDPMCVSRVVVRVEDVTMGPARAYTGSFSNQVTGYSSCVVTSIKVCSF